MNIEERYLPRGEDLPLVTRKQAHEYPDNLIAAMHILKFGNVKPNLGGSASIKSIKYFGDFDLISKIPPGEYSAPESYGQLTNIMKRSLEVDFLILDEVKFQTDKKKYRKMINKSEFMKIWDSLELVKYDYLLWANGIFYELSSIYAFKTGKGIQAYQDSIFDEIPELKADGNWFKILKRLYSISNLNKDKVRLKQLTDFFNKHGKYYRVMSNLQAIEKVYEKSKSKETLEKIHMNLERLGYNPEQRDFSKEIEGLFNKLQGLAKEFYDQKLSDIFQI